jgi:hypothetical protein
MSAHGRERVSSAHNSGLAMLQAVFSGEHTTFTVFRKLQPESATVVEELLADLPHELAIATNLTTGLRSSYRSSLISSSSGHQLSASWLGRLSELHQRVEDTVETLPDTIQGYIGKACILKTKSKSAKDGTKYVGLTFDDETSDILAAEQSKLREAANAKPLSEAESTPHITIAKTTDLKEAKKIKLHLNRSLSGLSGDKRTAILFGAVELNTQQR